MTHRSVRPRTTAFAAAAASLLLVGGAFSAMAQSTAPGTSRSRASASSRPRSAPTSAGTSRVSTGPRRPPTRSAPRSTSRMRPATSMSRPSAPAPGRRRQFIVAQASGYATAAAQFAAESGIPVIVYDAPTATTPVSRVGTPARPARASTPRATRSVSPFSSPEVAKSQNGGDTPRSRPRPAAGTAAGPPERTRVAGAHRAPRSRGDDGTHDAEHEATCSSRNGTSSPPRVSTATHNVLVPASTRSPALNTGPLPASICLTMRRLMNPSSEIQRRLHAMYARIASGTSNAIDRGNPARRVGPPTGSACTTAGRVSAATAVTGSGARGRRRPCRRR